MNNKLTPAALILLSAAYLSSIITMQVGVYDEGVILVGAERILKGHTPFKEFWSLYPPGQYYTLAFLFDIFGTSILVERIYDLTTKVLISLFIFLILKRLNVSNTVSFIFGGMSVIWIGITSAPVYPVYPSMLLIFISIYFFLQYMKYRKTHNLIISAVFVVFSSVFRHDIAGMTAIVVVTILILKHAKDKNPVWLPITIYTSVTAITGMSFLLYFSSIIDIHSIYNQLINIPAELLPKFRWLPYPALTNGLVSVPFYAFPLVVLIGLTVSIKILIKYKSCDNLCYSLLLFSLLGFLFLNQARIRSDITHLLPLALTALVIIPLLYSVLLHKIELSTHCLLFKRFHEKLRAFQHSFLFSLTPISKHLVLFILLFGLTVVSVKPTYDKICSQRIDAQNDSNELFYARAGYADLPEDLQKVIFYIHENTSDDESIYVGVKNHDQFIINDPLIYFLSARNYSTKYHELHPGVTNKSEIQNEIIVELKSRNTRMVILAPRYWYEPNLTKIDYKTELLDDYISHNFKLEAKYGIYEVWLKKQVGR